MAVFDQVVREIKLLGSPLAVKASLDHLALLYPDNYSWKDIAVELNIAELVPAVLVALILPGHLQSRDTDDVDRATVEANVSEAILPDSTTNETDDTVATRTLGLEVYQTISSQYSLPLTQQALLALTAFTRKEDFWTTSEIFNFVAPLLESQVLADGEIEVKKTLIVDTVLKGFIRPLFSKSRPTAITESSRKAEFENTDGKSRVPDDSPETKPWKFTVPYSVTIFEWAVKNSNEEIVSNNWPLYIPVLVTLLEDPDTPIRVRGLKILIVFLSKFQSKTLIETGLGDVFTEAVMPTLSYLPGLTPANESAQLLEPAFSALVLLSRKLHPQERYSAEKGMYLDKVLRDGVFMGYDHAKEHIKVVEALVNASNEIVEEMGIYSVKHLRYLINMYGTILNDPFSTAHPATIIAATKAVQTVLRNSWPRMDQKHYQDEIVQMLTLCWIEVLDDIEFSKNDPSTAEEVKSELKILAKMLSSCMEAAGDSLEERTATLVEQEPILQELFSGMEEPMAGS